MKSKYVRFARIRLPGISIAIIRQAWQTGCYLKMIHELRGRNVVSNPNGEIVEHRTDGDRWCWQFSRTTVSVWSCQRQQFV